MSFSRVLFVSLLVFAAVPSPWMSPPLALVLGVAFGMSFVHPFAAWSRNASRQLLKISIVGLGFGMDLQEVMHAGKSGFLYTVLGIAFALLVGAGLGSVLRVAGKASYLISVGTAICGGSAIAAVGPAIDASDEEMSVSIGTVFLLNAVGLLAFPPLGHALHMTERSFGLWAALAIHDTSSVVGAGAKYGPTALMVATTVKLARALWIVPLTVATAAVHARRSQSTAAPKPIQWPFFILFFLLAAVVNTYMPSPASPWLAKAGKVGLTVTLFLIGTGMSRATLRKVGPRPLVQGVILWVIVATGSALLIRAGWIGGA